MSSRAVVPDGGKNHIEIVSQRVNIVVVLQFNLSYGNKRIYHDQLPINRGKATNQLKPFRTHKALKVSQKRFVFLYLFFKSRALHCFLSLPQLTCYRSFTNRFASRYIVTCAESTYTRVRGSLTSTRDVKQRGD